ncbi:hypothetical protein GQ457_01G000400 [Hibiscus cannabinus]
MATSHARSIGFPSRSNPKKFPFCPCQKSAATSAVISICLKILISFCYCQTRQALFRGCNEKWVDELLDGVVLLLDACGIVKDVLLQSKEHIQGLQSMFRRRKADELEVAREISDYLASRKKAIKQVQQVVITALKSFLLQISGFKTQSKFSSWTLVSNLMRSNHVERSEFEEVGAALSMMLDHKAKKSNVEQELECLNKDLIKARALAREQHQKCIEQLLDGSVTLLDICSTAKDALLQTKECVQQLQSIFADNEDRKLDL